MSIENLPRYQIAQMTKHFEEIEELLISDNLSNYYHYRTKSFKRLRDYKEKLNFLQQYDYHFILQELSHQSVNPNILNELRTLLRSITSLIDTKGFLRSRFQRLFFNTIPAVMKCQRDIDVTKIDLNDVSKMSDTLLDKPILAKEFKDKLIQAEKSKSDIYEEFGWIKSNYYKDIFNLSNKVRKTIYHNFPIDITVQNNDSKVKERYFQKTFTDKLFALLEVYEIVNKNHPIDEDDFYKVLNFNFPENDLSKALKATKFAPVLKRLQEKINRLNLDEALWTKHITQRFGLNEATMKSYAGKNDEFNQIYSLIQSYKPI